MDQAVEALEQAPDYIGIGPVFPTHTKTDAAPALGPHEVGRIAKNTPITSAAIGGITVSNLPALLDCGVENFCVVAAVNRRRDPSEAIRELQQIWQNHCF